MNWIPPHKHFPTTFIISSFVAHFKLFHRSKCMIMQTNPFVSTPQAPNLMPCQTRKNHEKIHPSRWTQWNSVDAQDSNSPIESRHGVSSNHNWHLGVLVTNPWTFPTPLHLPVSSLNDDSFWLVCLLVVLALSSMCNVIELFNRFSQIPLHTGVTKRSGFLKHSKPPKPKDFWSWIL